MADRDDLAASVLSPRPKAWSLLEQLPGAEGPGVGAPSITGWHGSAAHFPRFDSAFIGTGEGAQAFGYGHYFGGKRGTGESYRESLSQGAPGTHLVGGKQVDPKAFTDAEALAYGAMRQGKIWGKTAEELLSQVPASERTPQSLIDEARQIAAAGGYEYKEPGALYEVNIKADPEHLLDYDKPLHEQTPHVRDKLATLGINAQPPTADMNELRRIALGIPEMVTAPQTIAQWVRNHMDEIRGQVSAATDPSGLYKPFQNMAVEYGFYPLTALGGPRGMYAGSKAHSPESQQAILDEIAKLRAAASPSPRGSVMLEALHNKFGGPPQAAQTLDQAGIPGIKYFDAGSRSAGEGSHNYVVFNDKLIDIVRKYGIAGALGAGLISEEIAEEMKRQGIDKDV